MPEMNTKMVPEMNSAWLPGRKVPAGGVCWDLGVSFGVEWEISPSALL